MRIIRNCFPLGSAASRKVLNFSLRRARRIKHALQVATVDQQKRNGAANRT